MRACLPTRMCFREMSWWEREREGVGGGCHGDSNTPVALPTCLPGPNLLGEGGEEGTEGGEAEGAETVGEGGGVRVKRQGKREEKRRVRKQEMEQTRKGLPVLYTVVHTFSV